MTQSREFISELLETESPSGFEKKISDVLCEWLPESATVERDSYGNTIATVNPGADRTLVLGCHLDEIGYMVRHITDEGFIYLQAVGGIDETVARGQRVTIHTEDGPVSGVMGGKSIHLLVDDENPSLPRLEDLWIDIGVSDGQSVRDSGVEVGNPVTFSSGAEVLENDTVAGRGLDNSIGIWAATEALRTVDEDELDCTVKLVATVLEETGMAGARMVRDELDHDAAIVLDTTFATGTPPISKKKHGNVEIDEGPVLRHGKENHRELVRTLKRLGADADIPLQNEAMDFRGPKEGMMYETTDADMFVSTGVPTAFVGIPTRYIHTPSEIVNMRDAERTRDLLVELAEQFSTTPMAE